MSAFSLARRASRRIAGRTKVSRAILVGMTGLMSYAAPLILFAVAAPAWLVVAAYGLAMAYLGFLNPVWETAVQRSAAMSASITTWLPAP